MKIELREFVEADSETTFEDGIVRNTLVLGSTSKNKRKYAPTAMQKAVSLYENAAVYTDHPISADKERHGRAAADRFGVLKNVKFMEQNGGQVRGDLHYLVTHPMASRLAEDWKRGLNFFGLSHLADGSGVTDRSTGITLVESIDKVTEVDLVTNPATAVSLREQLDEQPVMASPTIPSEAADHAQAVIESDRLAENALVDGVTAILKNPDMSLQEKAAKIQELFQTHLNVQTPEAAKEDSEVQEQVKSLSEKVAALSEQNQKLTEQVAAIKKRKYLPGGDLTTVNISEQVAGGLTTTDMYPTNGTAADKAAWLRRKNRA